MPDDTEDAARLARQQIHEWVSGLTVDEAAEVAVWLAEHWTYPPPLVPVRHPGGRRVELWELWEDELGAKERNWLVSGLCMEKIGLEGGDADVQVR